MLCMTESLEYTPRVSSLESTVLRVDYRFPVMAVNSAMVLFYYPNLFAEVFTGTYAVITFNYPIFCSAI